MELRITFKPTFEFYYRDFSLNSFLSVFQHNQRRRFLTPLFLSPKTLCDLLEPCLNHATCKFGFSGAQCQFDHRLCQSDTCWNNGMHPLFYLFNPKYLFTGKCNETSNTTFTCTCADGWEGIRCERKINFCHNITCHNKGVCRPLLGRYKCECLGDHYYGEHCEFTTPRIIIYKTVSKSLAYIAILAMTIVVMFVVIMDVLKYCFGIDPVHEERERLQQEKRQKKRKPVIQRFTYVNAPPPPSSEKSANTTAETTV